MFAIVPAPLFADTRLSRTDMRVFGALATFADADTRTCWPSRKTIAKRCGIKSVSLISASLSRLVKFGWIEIKHRLGSSLYRLLDPLHNGVDAAVHNGVDDIEQTISIDQSLPLPQESKNEVEEGQEPEIDSLNEPQTPPEAPTHISASPQAENGSESPADPADEITAQDVVQAAILMHFTQLTGIDCDSPRHRKAITRSLKTNTPDEIKLAASHCAATWSNRTWATPAAVLKPGRVEEVLSQAKATAAPRAAAHKLFEREPETPRAKPETVRSHLSALKAALGG